MSRTRVTLEYFVERLMAGPRGQIIVCNALDGLYLELFDRAFVREVFHWWRALFVWQRTNVHPGSVAPSKEQEVLAESLHLLVHQDLPPGFRTEPACPKFRLRASSSSMMADACVHVMNASRFVSLMAEQDRRRLAADQLLSVSPERHRDSIGVATSVKVRLRAGCVLGPPRGVLWLTRAATLDSARTADALRDCLGLVHHSTRATLLAIRLSDRSHAEMTRPAFTDAGGHRRFRARADAALPTAEVWGRAVDLERFASESTAVDGEVESVTAPIHADSLGPVEVTPFGPITYSRGTGTTDDDEAFAKRLCSRLGGKESVAYQVKEIVC